MDKPKFEFLDDTNLFLGNVTGYADKAFANLEGASQSTVDVTTAEVAYNMSVGIESMRKGLIKSLHGIYSGYLAVINKFGKLATMSISDPLKLLEPVLEMRKIITGPYDAAVEIVAELTPKITELTANLNKIAGYQPPKLDLDPTPGTFKLTVGSVTMAEIISGVPKEVKIEKPDVAAIKKRAQEKAAKDFQGATASTANTMSTNKDKVNTLKFATVNDPQGTGSAENKVDLEELTQIEEKVLGYTNADQVLAYRFGVLEHDLFGHAFAGLLDERFDRIKTKVKEDTQKRAQEQNKKL